MPSFYSNNVLIARIELAANLLCETHKPGQLIGRINNLIKQVAALVRNQPMTMQRRELITRALLASSDATEKDFEIINGKIYIGSPMYLDPDELAKRILW